MPPQEKKADARVWPVIKAYSKASLRYPLLLGITVLSNFVIQGASLVVPLYLKHFIDLLSTNATIDATVRALFVVLAGYAAFGILNWIFRSIQRFSINKVEADVMSDLENSAFATLLEHSYDFFTSNFTGTLVRRITRYSRSFEQMFDGLMFNLMPTLIFAAGSIGVLYSRNHWLGIALFVWVVVFVSVQVVLTRWRHPLRVARAAFDSRMTGALSDVVSNNSTVKTFASESYERSTFASVVGEWRATTLRSWNADSIIQIAQQGLGLVIEVGLLGIAVILWQRHVVTVGDFVLIQIYVLGLIEQVWYIGNILRGLFDSFADATEMINIIELPRGVLDTPTATTLSVPKGVIAFKDVLFYFTKDRPILEQFDLRITGGEKVALVGPSGAGKSTITKLLLRLYDVSGGSVEIDGQDVRSVTQKSLRENIAFVPQDPVLFHRTLRENIAYGKRNATEEEIIEASKKAHCHEFISALANGYDTYVGERGIKLSGGERQRVAIARAILKDAPILVLDEATSSLDSESEALIQDALSKLMEGKTVIAIAHRLSTVMKMDRIVVIEGGKAVLSGTHDELLAQESNLYKKLWEIQAGGFILDDE